MDHSHHYHNERPYTAQQSHSILSFRKFNYFTQFDDCMYNLGKNVYEMLIKDKK